MLPEVLDERLRSLRLAQLNQRLGERLVDVGERRAEQRLRDEFFLMCDKLFPQRVEQRSIRVTESACRMAADEVDQRLAQVVIGNAVEHDSLDRRRHRALA